MKYTRPSIYNLIMPAKNGLHHIFEYQNMQKIIFGIFCFELNKCLHVLYT